MSIISETFYTENFHDKQIKPLHEILDIECANGDKLQYKGYVELDLTVNEGLPQSAVLKCLSLV